MSLRACRKIQARRLTEATSLPSPLFPGKALARPPSSCPRIKVKKLRMESSKVTQKESGGRKETVGEQRPSLVP